MGHTLWIFCPNPAHLNHQNQWEWVKGWCWSFTEQQAEDLKKNGLIYSMALCLGAHVRKSHLINQLWMHIGCFAVVIMWFAPRDGAAGAKNYTHTHRRARTIWQRGVPKFDHQGSQNLQNRVDQGGSKICQNRVVTGGSRNTDLTLQMVTLRCFSG